MLKEVVNIRNPSLHQHLATRSVEHLTGQKLDVTMSGVIGNITRNVNKYHAVSSLYPLRKALANENASLVLT